MSRRTPIRCVCGHAWSSHRPDPVDPYIAERCVTCGCAGFENRDDATMQSDDPEEMASHNTGNGEPSGEGREP